MNKQQAQERLNRLSKRLKGESDDIIVIDHNGNKKIMKRKPSGRSGGNVVNRNDLSDARKYYSSHGFIYY